MEILHTTNSKDSNTYPPKICYIKTWELYAEVLNIKLLERVMVKLNTNTYEFPINDVVLPGKPLLIFKLKESYE